MQDRALDLRAGVAEVGDVAEPGPAGEDLVAALDRDLAVAGCADVAVAAGAAGDFQDLRIDDALGARPVDV
ncbi:hypothetical protein [Nonomuraea sp. NPDC049695]|uniref:hypothetical protein n=1 Tax=Nonomuraea sp. NPDC049695 TaxID=3154734 RepID=UPI0034320E39